MIESYASSFCRAQTLGRDHFAHGHHLGYRIGPFSKAFKELKKKFLGGDWEILLRIREQSIRRRGRVKKWELLTIYHAPAALFAFCLLLLKKIP